MNLPPTPSATDLERDDDRDAEAQSIVLLDTLSRGIAAVVTASVPPWCGSKRPARAALQAASARAS